MTIDAGSSPQALLEQTSLADVLGSANPYKNQMSHLEADDEFRKQFPDVVDDLHKQDKTGTVNLMRSAGPISDRYILSHNPADLIIGPGGSGKTIASGKKALVEAQRIFPGADGVRRYVLGTWRQKYVNIWKATIPSWWKLFPKDMPGSKWTGASPREAEHTLSFEDEFGRVMLTNRFRAFGETMDPDDILGNEFTDCYFNEWPTLPEELCSALVDRVGREPPREIIKRAGRFYGDGNAPDVLHFIYRDFYENKKPGHVLHAQPSGLADNAENIEAMGRGYYENSAMMNSHRPWWIKRMIHARPGFTRANNPVWPEWDEDRNMAKYTIPVIKELPVITGTDGGLTPTTVYMQEKSNGQLRILAECPLDRGGMSELATAMLQLEATRFEGCEFLSLCDPAMCAGEDLEAGSDRQNLAKFLGRRVHPAPTNNPTTRHEAMKSKLRHTCEAGEPGLVVDPSCKTIRRGAAQTYHFKHIAGTDDLGSVAKTKDGHTCEAAEYGALACGSSEAKRRVGAAAAQRAQRKEEARNAGRYNPMKRKRG
ncbi:hypothetical protein IVB40_07585 [Bradyrhizobium sp. 40]|uniref:hypothetical protein n=1 Tax=Bradyrhizobium sp. 40 TaxID=2782674 RepID=UPI001FFFF237|nr:hypothetical protein [Bradyrhizobium sp. 40]UPJ43922.1 hypothetical protein IVB40_07585 [Bradyrhizobium sp. 40]